MVDSVTNDRAAESGADRAEMSPAEFAVFFQKVCEAADASEQARAAGAGPSPAAVLRDFGLEVDLPPAAQSRLSHLLTATRGADGVVRTYHDEVVLGASECGVCGVCGVCAACGGANFGAPGAAAAAIWAVL